MDTLTAQRLTVTIAGKRICHDLDLVIRSGERWAILGPNGSGKTTLLHTLAGLRPAQGGEIRLRHRPISTWHPRERATMLGTLLQHYDDPFPSTVLETALIGRHPFLKRWQWADGNDIAQAQTALTSMDLSGFENRTIATLSGGERRRLAIATLLTQNPQFMLLDEPTNHLDLMHQIQTLSLFNRLVTQQNRALVMVLHDITSAVHYCDHALLVFGDGKTLTGTITAVINEANLSRLYGHAIRRLVTPEGDVWAPAFSND